MVLVQNWPFFRLFFFGGMGKENVSYDILERRNVFLGYKNNIFKKSKNCKIGQEKVFFEGSERKKSLFRPKKHRLKKLPKFKFF